MAKKKNADAPKSKDALDNVYIAGAGLVADQPITETLESNYMPYAMSVIVSRAIPEIDGFKPAHRKLLFTMYEMGLLKGAKTKSANIVGRTMQLNPHGDSAIYETMIRLSEGNESLLHPFIDSKGNFGKSYSKGAYAASRYTEAKLAEIANELFRDIDKDTVDFVDNYDSTKKEPVLFPVTFPSVLVNSNKGIAVGMAANICPFNIEEVCKTTIEYIKDNDVDITSTLLAPDFPVGGELLYDKESMEEIYRTGKGSFKVRSVYEFFKKENRIEVTQIPPTTTVEDIIDKTIELIKAKKVTEINDIRDETDKNGLKIAIEVKRGTDVDKLMTKLFKLTPFEDSFACNFNVLVGGYPRVMGVREILDEWLTFRVECVCRRVQFMLNKAQKRLHLLKGLSKILLDIDKAVQIVRETESEKEVVPNLMLGFGIDEVQAEYVAEIKLRHLNREYILKQIKDVEDLEKEIEDYNKILNSYSRVNKIIIKELEEVIKKYGKPRRTRITDASSVSEYTSEEKEIPDTPVHIFFTREGYFKKITPQSLRMSGEQKLKDGDEIIYTNESSNAKELLFFTDKQQVYKTYVYNFADSKASVLGDYVPSVLEMDEGENALYMVETADYSGYLLFIYSDGHVAKIPLNAYETKTNRKKLINAYSAKEELVGIIYITEDTDVLLSSTGGRMLLFSTEAVPMKTTKTTLGIKVMTQKRGHRVAHYRIYTQDLLENAHKYRAKNLPAAGYLPPIDKRQMKLF